MRCLYVDLDGTLLGPGGAFFLDAEKQFTLLGARALEACARADCEVVIMTGRQQTSTREDARLLGHTSYIFEAGACVVLDGEEHWLTGDYRPGELSIHDQIEAAGAPQLLLDAYPGLMEHHSPWHLNREVSHIFRGLIDVDEATALLEANGHGGLRVLDNGPAHRRSEALAALPYVRVYHLLPKGASKANAVEFHRGVRGYARGETIACGDSPEDLQTAAAVGMFWLMANGAALNPDIARDAGAFLNVRTSDASFGAGVYEAVVTTLAERTAAL
jgi:hydroxymethylpyrimidine pyrophosphatase-like HAD family hydrolase